MHVVITCIYCIVTDSMDKEEDKNEPEEVSKIPDDKLSTKKPGLLLLPNDNTVLQIDCGMTHTGY